MKTPSPAAPVGEIPTAESLGWQLRSALPPMRLNSVSICDKEADVLWLSEGALGPDEHSVVIEAIGELTSDTSLPYFEFGMEDGRLAVFLAVRAPKGDLVGMAMILAEMKAVPDGVVERIITPQVRTILQKIAVFLRTKTPGASETGATVAMPAAAAAAAAVPTVSAVAEASGESLPAKRVDEILTLELAPEPVVEPPKPAPAAAKGAVAAPAAKAAPVAKAAPAAAKSIPAAKAPPAAPAAKKAPAAPPAAPAAKPAGTSKVPAAPAIAAQALPAAQMAELEFTIEDQRPALAEEEATAEVPAVSEEFVLSVADTGMMEVIPASGRAKTPAAPAPAKPPVPPTLQPPPIAAPAPAAVKPVPAPKPAAAAPAAKEEPEPEPTLGLPVAPVVNQVTAAKVAAAFEDPAEGSAARSDLVLHIQELIKLRSNGRTRRYEVLARSRADAARDEVPPAYIAESAKGHEGSVLDGFVVQRLLTWLSENGDTVWDTEPASFSINLSIGSIENERFPERIAQALEASGVPAEHIGFEITEFACVQCKPQVQRFVEMCERLGCFLVLDNFTFDARSLNLLGSGALRAVKIDPKLTSIAMKDKLSQAIVVAIAQACKVMGVHCVAKRIDSQAGLQWLTAVGCDFAQGFALEKPLPLESLLLPAPKRK